MMNDRNLTIARLATQGGLITPAQRDQAMAAWATDPMIPLGEILQVSGFIDGPTRERLERQADEGDPPSTSPIVDVSEAFRGLADQLTLFAPGQTLPGGTIAVADLDATIASDSAVPIVELSPTGHVRLSTLGEPSTGETRTRYARSHIHAQGGIGQVWLARDGELGREEALKELRPEQGKSSVAWSRFVDEARITGQLEHPGIVPVYELSVHPEDGDPFYTMRFIRGKTLNRAIRDYHARSRAGQSGALDLVSLLTDFVSLCNTVGYAHSRGVIHRDLKGQNVVLGDFGEVILLDWGIAKLVDQDDLARGNSSTGEMPALIGNPESGHEATVAGQILGTPFYMAPEQAEGRIEAIDRRTDVYGLGAILYEILVGKAPYEGDKTGDILRKVANETPASPHQINPGVPRALEAVCLKAMSKQPAGRYPTALALAEEVRRWLADEPVTAYREPWPTRLARASKRHRTAVAAAAVLVLTAFVALSVSSVLIKRERDEARRQREQARRAVDDSYTRVAEEWLADRLDPLQREFLEKALVYYRDFAGSDEADPTLGLERGRAHLRLGDVLRKLGRHDEAESSYRSSIAILGPLADGAPADLGGRDLLAEANYRLGSEQATRQQAASLAEADRLFRLAASTQEALLTTAPAPIRRVALGRTLTAWADLQRVLGRADDAEATYRRAIPLLQGAAADGPGGLMARHELALALDGQGFLRKERGRGDEAKAPVRQAVEMFETLVAEAPARPLLRDGLAKSYNTLGLLLRDTGPPAEAEAVLKKEVALNRQLANEYPARPEYRRTLARALINRGIIDREANRTRDADAAYTEALALNEKLAADAPGDRKYARDRARCLSNLGELKAGRKGEAEPLYRKALKIYQALAAEAPGVPEYRIDEAGVLQNLGTLLVGDGRGEEAIEALLQAVARFDELSVADPGDPGIRRGLARSLNSLGAAYAAGGRTADAEGAYSRAVHAYDLLVARPPPLRADRLNLATCLSNQGDNQSKSHLPAAEGSLRRSLNLLDALAAEGPPAPDLRLRLAAARNNLGEWLAEAGRPDEAEVAFQGSVDLFGALAQEFPKVPSYKSTLGQARANLGEFLIAQGRPDDARTLLEQGILEERSALAAGPEARETLRKHLATLASLHLNSQAHAEAARVGEELLKVPDSTPSVLTEVARLMVRCMPMATADSKLTAPRRAILAGAYADRAIALLREATAGGGPEADRLLQDSTFDAIRERDGFKALEHPKLGQYPGLNPLDLAAKPRHSAHEPSPRPSSRPQDSGRA